MSAYVYILFNRPDENLIIGVTSNLLMHMHEIKNKIFLQKNISAIIKILKEYKEYIQNLES